MDIKQQLIEQLNTLANQNYEWSEHGRIQHIKRLIVDADVETLRNRKSALHLSASAFVIKNQRAVFIKHPYLHTMLLPAGHVEPSELPVDCAVREFHEETGFTAISKPKLIDINIIDIPANPIKAEFAHQHIDFRYTFQSKFTDEDIAELPVFLLTKQAAPAEFQPYFSMYDI